MVDETVYEYQPEESVTKERYEAVVAEIERMQEDIGQEHIDCENGACPVDFNGSNVAA